MYKLYSRECVHPKASSLTSDLVITKVIQGCVAGRLNLIPEASRRLAAARGPPDAPSLARDLLRTKVILLDPINRECLYKKVGTWRWLVQIPGSTEDNFLLSLFNISSNIHLQSTLQCDS